MQKKSLTRAFYTTLLALGMMMPASYLTQQALAETDVWDGTLRRPNNGSGTEVDPYLISSAEEFAFLMQNYDNASGICLRKYYKLTNDLDMVNLGYSYGIATTANRSFIAQFDGDGHKISNVHLVVADNARELHVGLFPQLGGDEGFQSAVRNLEVDNVRISYFDKNSTLTAGSHHMTVSALVGQMYGNAVVENCIANNVVLDASFSSLLATEGAWVKAGPLVGDYKKSYDKDKGSKVPESALVHSYGEMSDGCKAKGLSLAATQGKAAEGKYNGFTWHRLNDSTYSLLANSVTILPVEAEGVRKYRAEVSKPGKYTYRWIYDDKVLPTKGTECTVPYLTHNETLSVEVLNEKGNLVTSDGIMTEAPDLQMHALSMASVAGGKSYNIKAEVVGLGAQQLASELSYQWIDLTDGNKIVGSSINLVGAHSGHTYLGLARSNRNARYAASTLCSLGKVVYVCLHGITTADDIKQYTFDGKTAYPEGNDSNDGSAPGKAVKTLRRAMELVTPAKNGGTVASNVIVIMGDYDQNDLAQYIDSEANEANPGAIADLAQPAIICGNYGNIRNGELMANGAVQFNADTRLENLTLHGMRDNMSSSQVIFYAQNHNITFGYGLHMTDYGRMDLAHGLPHGMLAPMISVYGGFLNPDVEEFDYKENTIQILSGYYGRLIAGSRFTRNCYTSGNMSGSPRKPMRPHLVVDVCNQNNPDAFPFDVCLLLGGQADGSCWATTTIDVKGSSRVGRIVGGNMGFGRAAAVKNQKGELSARPSDSFFGHSTINIESGIVQEVYGTSVARTGHNLFANTDALIDSCATYFYGRAEINISGGEVRNTIYGAGAGGVTGVIGDLNDEAHHTFDPLLPYSTANGKIAYGEFAKAHNKMPRIIDTDGSLIYINFSEIAINISDKAHLKGSVYGGGLAFSEAVQTSEANSQTGNMYGTISVNMTGGTVDGYIFGAGCGNLSYYDNYDQSGYPAGRSKSYFKAMAQYYGNTNVNITGGEVKGMVFGGGEGCYYRATSDKDATNEVADMANVYGSTNITIDGNAQVDDFVFGAGNYGSVCALKDVKGSGDTHVNILGGKVGNSIFGAGHGHYEHAQPELSVLSNVEGSANVLIKGGEFFFLPQGSRYAAERYYGVFGSGRTASIVKGNTYVEAHRSLFSQAMLDSVGCHYWNTNKSWDQRFALCGGGSGDMADVLGDTHVLINVDGIEDQHGYETVHFDMEKVGEQVTIPYISFTDVFGGGLKGNVYGSTNVTVKGHPFIRNLYGGALQGDCGLTDRSQNGTSIFDHSNAERNYTTRTTTNVLSGRILRLYGGSLMGDIMGETEVNIGSLTDTISNKSIYIGRITAGNDATGSIAGGNNERYGAHLNIYGGTIMYDVYGSGDGEDLNSEHMQASRLSKNPDAPVMRARPHVASTMINVQGASATNRADILGTLYCGGNNTTVGLFQADSSYNNQDWGLFREVLVPNSGRVEINVGNHVSMGSLVMGCNGRQFLTKSNIPYSTTNGKEWYQGFLSNEDFEHFCRAIDMSCVPTLTFNADGKFHNDYPIDDRMGDKVEFNTPGEMDARDIRIGNFVGGGYRGSMTSDSCYIYTLPLGVTIMNQVVGGAQNAHFTYTEKAGPDKGTKREKLGGIAPYHDSFIMTDRLQLNLFNRFADMQAITDKNGNPSHKGAKVFTGCLDYGVIMGYASLNYHSDIIGNYQLKEGESWVNISREWNSETGYIYGAGKGENTEILGNTYINIRGCVLNGEKCLPNCLNVFGGGLAGRVIGRTNVGVDIQCKGSTSVEAAQHAVWGNVYGGGRMGDVCEHSTLMPQFHALSGVSTHVRVHSGRVGEVFGGARMADIEGGTWVEIEDHSTDHFHAIIDRVFGGSDLSGSIGVSKHVSKTLGNEFESNTYVYINEAKHDDGTFTGFPLIGEVYAGGNGEYGTPGSNGHYGGGQVLTRSGGMIDLAGMPYPDVDSTYLEINGGTILSAFGGANSSNVLHKSNIVIDYPNKQDKAHFDRTLSESCFARGKDFLIRPALHEGFSNDGSQILFSNNICRLYGGNNKTPLTLQPDWYLERADIGTIYGGCNNGDVLYYKESGDRNLYPEAGGSPGLWLVLCNDGLKIDNVYGGSRMGDIRPSKITFDPATNRSDTTQVQLADNQYASVILITAGQYGRVFGGNDVTGYAHNGTRIQVQGGHIGSIYGAGNGHYLYKWDPAVSHITETWDEALQQYVYLTPTDPNFPNAVTDDNHRLHAINFARPHSTKSLIEVGGGMNSTAYVNDGIFSGGNCATIIGKEPGKLGDVVVDLGDNAVINSLYIGSDAKDYINQKYVTELFSLNGINDLTQQTSYGQSLLDVYMNAVALYGMPKYFHFRNNYENCYIGSFYLGGRHASLVAHGSLDITFPRQLKFFDKIVGGADRADITVTAPDGQLVTHNGGILWDRTEQAPTISMDVQCQFIDAQMDLFDESLSSDNYLRFGPTGRNTIDPNIYNGCYQSGKVEGNVDIQVDGAHEEEIFF